MAPMAMDHTHSARVAPLCARPPPSPRLPLATPRKPGGVRLTPRIPRRGAVRAAQGGGEWGSLPAARARAAGGSRAHAHAQTRTLPRVVASRQAGRLYGMVAGSEAASEMDGEREVLEEVVKVRACGAWFAVGGRGARRGGLC